MPETDLELLQRGVAKAGKIAMHYFGHDPDTWDKGGSAGPVTEADLAIDRMLKELLLAARPDYGWLSEETDDDPDRFNHDAVFIVDPIDGTRSFINQHENFATSIAVARRGEVVASVVHLPAKKTPLTFAAAKGQGATLNGAPISHNGRETVERARILAAGPQLSSAVWKDAAPPVERHFRSSLAYRLCLVAQGRFDGMLTLRNTWEWDVAGGDLICQEAGVRVTTADNERPVYNSPKACLNGMIAAPPILHKGLMGYL